MALFGNNKPNDAVEDGAGKPPEKTQAELIAESVTAAMKPLIDANAALQSRVDGFIQTNSRPAKVETPEAQAAASVFDDEDQAFAQRIGPVAQRQLSMEAKFARSEVRQEYVALGYGDLWTTYEAEINKTLDESPLVNGDKLCRGDHGYIRNVVDMVFGRAALKSGMRFGGKDKGFFIESAGGDGGNTVTSPTDDGLTAEQRKVFGRMKISPEAAKKTMATLKFIH